MNVFSPRACLAFALVLCVAAFVPACGSDNEDESDDGGYDQSEYQDFVNAIPSAESLRMTLPGSEEKAVGDYAKYYEETVEVTRETNQWTLEFLSFIDEILSYPPTTFDGETAVWGPIEATGLEAVDWRFIMTRHADGSFVYQCDWRDKNLTGDDDFVTIWDGYVEESDGTTERRGIGNYQIDFDLAYSLDPTMEALGALEVDYDTLTAGRRIDVTYINFLPEDLDEGVDGTYHYVENADGSGVFLFDIWGDLHQEEYGNQYPLREHYWFNTQWGASGVGRCDVVVNDGEIPGWDGSDLIELRSSECWNDNFRRLYYVEEAVYEGGAVYPYLEEGDPDDCSFAQQFPEAK